MQKSLITDIFIDSNDEIEEYMSDQDVMDHIRWYLEENNDDQLIKKLKLLIFDYERVDILLYDIDMTYMQFINSLCRLIPSMMTPHIIKMIRNRYDEFEDAGVCEPKSNMKLCDCGKPAESGGYCLKCEDQYGELSRNM